MSFNDRCEEAARWIAAHPRDDVLIALPRDLLAEALHDMALTCAGPDVLRTLARRLAPHGAAMCEECWRAAGADWDDDDVPGRHGDCDGLLRIGDRTEPCRCPCRGEAT